MSPPTQTRPKVTLYPSPRERLNSYMAAIRLASSARNSMDAQKSGADAEKITPLADSDGRHHQNVPPHPPAKSATPGGRETDRILNQTASAYFASNTTKAGFVHSRDGNPPPSHSASTAINRSGATLEILKRHQGYFPPPDPPKTMGDDTPTDVKPEALKQHNGYFPPPDPPINSSQAGRRVRRRGFPLPATALSSGTDPSTTPLPPNGIPPECQLYVHDTDPVTSYICPKTEGTNLASGQLHTENLSVPDILEISDPNACKVLTSFKERVLCDEDVRAGLAILSFIVCFLVIILVGKCILTGRKCVVNRRRNKSPKLDVENAPATWPRPATTPASFALQRMQKPRDLNTLSMTTNSSETTLREDILRPLETTTDSSETTLREDILRPLETTTDSSETTLREDIRTGYELDEGVDAVQYEPVAWRSRERRAERVLGGGRVGRDAGSVGVLPGVGEMRG